MAEAAGLHRGLHGQVVQNLGLRIVRGEFRPGDVLPTEERLGEELTVSRTVLREAMKVLAAKGLVETRPKTGTRVRERHEWHLLDPDVVAWRVEVGPDLEFIRQVFAVRRLIEPAAVRLAAVGANDDERAELELAVGDMERAVASGQLESHVAADLRFHTLVYRSCGNELLAEIAELLRSAYRATFMLITELPGSAETALPLHRAVLEAILARDAEAAEQATHVLLDRSEALSPVATAGDGGPEKRARGARRVTRSRA